MELGGLVAHALRILLSDPDVMFMLITFMLGSTITLVALKLKDRGGNRYHN